MLQTWTKLATPNNPTDSRDIISNYEFWFDTQLIFFTAVGFTFLVKFRCKSSINSHFTRTTFSTISYKSLSANHSCKLFNQPVSLSASQKNVHTPKICLTDTGYYPVTENLSYTCMTCISEDGSLG